VALRLLGRHVERRAGDRAGHRQAGHADDLGDAEVGQYRHIAIGKHHVGGFEIAVNRALLVSVVDRVAQRGDHALGLVERHAHALRAQPAQARVERLSGNVLHDHVGHAVLDVEVDDLHDVGVAQRRDQARLAAETVDEALGVGQVRMDEFDGDRTPEAGLRAQVHVGHAAAPQQPAHLVAAQALAGPIGHGSC
jgi:hypothetical protein